MKNLPLMYFEAKPPKLYPLSAPLFLTINLQGDVLYFIKDHTSRLRDPKQAHKQSNEGHGAEQLPLGASKL